MYPIVFVLITLTLLPEIVVTSKINETLSSSETFYAGSPSIEWSTLSPLRDLALQTVSIVHLQSMLTIMTSEQDFPLNISSDSKVIHIRYPQSYRTSVIQIGSSMQKTFFNIYSTMYRMQLAAQRIPSFIKTILKLLTSGSSVLTEKMLPKQITSISQVANDNKIAIRNITAQLDVLLDFYDEIKQYTIDLSFKPDKISSSTTDITVYKEFRSKKMLENIAKGLLEIKSKLSQVAEIVANLDIEAKFNVQFNKQAFCLIPTLRTTEHNAYYIYQLSNVYGNILSQYILDETAGFAKYAVLSTEKERSEKFSELSKKLLNIIEAITQLLNEKQNEFESSTVALNEAYENLMRMYQCRS